MVTDAREAIQKVEAALDLVVVRQRPEPTSEPVL